MPGRNNNVTKLFCTSGNGLLRLFVVLDHQWIIIRSRLPALSFWQKLPAVTSACSPSHLCHHYRAWDNNNKKKINHKEILLMNHYSEKDLCDFRLTLSFRITYYLLLQLIEIKAQQNLPQASIWTSTIWTGLMTRCTSKSSSSQLKHSTFS